MGMSIAETVRLQTLERQVAEVPELKARIEALEAQRAATQPVQHASRAVPAPLQQINTTRQGRRARLCEAIASILARSRHPDSLTGKDVEQALAGAGFEPMPKARTVRLRLAEVRAEMATHGNTGNCQKTV